MERLCRVMVTGGAGFVGSAVVRHLVSEIGAEVLTVDKLTYAGNLASLKAIENAPNHRFLKADIGDGAAMREAFATFRPGHVIHLAAESHVDRSITGSAAFVETNIVGTFTLLEAARAHRAALPAGERPLFRFLHVSTDEVYGSLGAEGAFTEASAYDPSSPYAASKAAGDHLARAWHRTYGLPTIVTHSTNNYGPRQFPEKLIPLTVLNALEGLPLPVYGTGENVRDWLHVDDHARALTAIAAAGRPGETYNVGGRNERRNIDVVARICATMDGLRPGGAPHRRLIAFVADRPGHDRRYALDTTRIESELGWRAAKSFEAGIDGTVAWYLENEWWWRPLRGRGHGDARPGPIRAEPATG